MITMLHLKVDLHYSVRTNPPVLYDLLHPPRHGDKQERCLQSPAVHHRRLFAENPPVEVQIHRSHPGEGPSGIYNDTIHFQKGQRQRSMPVILVQRTARSSLGGCWFSCLKAFKGLIFTRLQI